jgi:predicted enzyme involved in methoxymalonyl-ACP biosynthesis
VRSKDRFGDNGLISVVMARETAGRLEIEDWVMSCRVFNRGIEDLVFNEIVSEARRRGLACVTGIYRQTPKNDLVRRLYERLGFECQGDSTAEMTYWSLLLTPDVATRPHQIRQSCVATSKSLPSMEHNHESRAA